MLKVFLASVVLSASLWAGDIRVAVAANLADVIEVLKVEFAKSNPSIKVDTVLGASGKFTAQIKSGAPFDLFISADMQFPEALYKENIAVTKPVVYASGALAMMSVRGLDLGKGLGVVADKKVEKIALANPKTAPYGAATVEALKQKGLYETAESKLVYGESISHTVSFAITAADIGFVNASAFYGEKMKQYVEGKDWVKVDPSLYAPINQGIVVLKQAQNNAEAKAFYDFVLSGKAKQIFKNYGYLVNE